VVTGRALTGGGAGIDAKTRARMCETWLSLPAFPDARQALESLGRRGCGAPSSPTAPGMIRAALAGADLEVDDGRSADEVRAYKPDPRVYAALPRERTFRERNGWDAEGAKRNGLDVAGSIAAPRRRASPPDLHALAGEPGGGDLAEQGVRV